MSLLNVLSAPWAIQPQKLIEIQGIYAAHVRGERIDIEAVEQRLGRPLANEPKAYDVIDGVAVINVEGVLAKRMNLMTQISGGTSTELLARDIRAAGADVAVHSIVLAVDSPGGTVDGTQALADEVRAVRDIKPTVTLASGTMASAAYWVGSAASRAYISDATTQVGSIGVVATHTDVSGAEAAKGIKTTEVVAGQYKRVASQYGPLTEAGRQSIQDQVDYTYGVFVDAVAANRGVSTAKVLADMADGRIFLGQQAVAAGLVDGITTLSQLVQDLSAAHRATATGAKATATTPPKTHQGAAMPITREQLAQDAPDLMAAIQADGAAQERARIQSVEAQCIPGHEALIASLKFDGVTSGNAAAAAVVAAERGLRASAAHSLAAEAPAPIHNVVAPPVTFSQPDASQDMSLPLEVRCKAHWDASAETRKEFAYGGLASYTAFVGATERGAAKIFNSSKQGA